MISRVVLPFCIVFILPNVFASQNKLANFVSKNEDLQASGSAYAKVANRDDEPKFAIGLGTLSPSYSQKLGPDGRTKLDFNQEKNGFSYSINNMNHQHSLQTGESGNSVTKEIDPNIKNHNIGSMGYIQPNQPNVNIYHQQGAGLNPFSLPMSAYGSNYGLSNGQLNSNMANNMMPFSYGQYSNAYPAASNYFNTFGTLDNLAQNNQKSALKSDSSSTSSSNSQTLPGGMFNYGISQNHGLAMPTSMPNQMNFAFNPYAATTPSPTTSSTTQNPTQNTTPSPMFPFSNYIAGFDPFSFMAGQNGGFANNFGGYGMNMGGMSNNMNMGGMSNNMNGQSASASSPYSYFSSMYPGMMPF